MEADVVDPVCDLDFAAGKLSDITTGPNGGGFEAPTVDDGTDDEGVGPSPSKNAVVR